MRSSAAGGITGPVAFAAAWAILGARRVGYSPVDEPISRLAAASASTRAPMTLGLLAFAAGVGAYVPDVRRAYGSPAAIGATASAVGAAGIAATPLDSSLGGAPHAVAAGLTYLGLATTPMLAARRLAADGHTTAARASVVAGAVAGVALAGSAVAPRAVGLLQRTGLTIGQAWLAISAVRVLRSRHADRDAQMAGWQADVGGGSVRRCRRAVIRGRSRS